MNHIRKNLGIPAESAIREPALAAWHDGAAGISHRDQRSAPRTHADEISTMRVIEEMAKQRVIDDIDTAAAACLNNGEYPKRLQELATQKKWEARPGPRNSSRAAAVSAQWFVHQPEHEMAVAQSHVIGSGLYACSVTANLSTPAEYRQLKTAFERRFNVSSVSDAADGSELRTTYIIPHAATCDTRASLIGSPLGPKFTLWMWHGRRYMRDAQARTANNAAN